MISVVAQKRIKILTNRTLNDPRKTIHVSLTRRAKLSQNMFNEMSEDKINDSLMFLWNW